MSVRKKALPAILLICLFSLAFWGASRWHALPGAGGSDDVAAAKPAPAAPAPAGVQEQTPIKIGEFEQTDLALSYQDETSWRQVIHYPDASFIKVHLRQIDLKPGDAVVVSDPAGEMVHTYPGSGYTTDDGDGIWAFSIVGDTAIVQLHPGGADPAASPEFYEKAQDGAPETALGVRIDKFTRGYPQEVIDSLVDPASTCGSNERTDVVCYENSHPTEYEKADAVARAVLNGGTSLCTAWRVSHENFVLTNEHCITSQNGVDNAEFWFDYQRSVCESGSANTPTIVAGDQFLTDDYTLDFALVTLDNFPSIEHFGYLELDPRTPVLGEEIYIAQHGAGNPKEFGIDSDFNPPDNLCQIDDEIRDGRGTNTDTGYFCDTTGGSSGSPVLARSTHKVIGLHHFGTGGAACGGSTMNAGVRIELIYPLIESYLPDPFADFTLDVTPESVAVCAPDDATYDVSVGQVLSYTEMVTLTAAGVPAGATATFTPNNQTVPYSSTLTIGNTGAAATGNYAIDVIGMGPTATHTATVQLALSDSAPGTPTLVAPADGATGVNVTPDFEWTAASQAASYRLEVATDAAFSNVVYSATVPTTTHTMSGALAPVTPYYWHVRAENACGTGSYSSTFSFITADVPPILLVDDDDNNPDVRSYYTDALDALGLDYDVWDTDNSDTEPGTADLAPYQMVVWFTGEEFGGAAGPGSAGETALGTWLDDGNCLFLSSQDYRYDRGLTSFMQNYLGAAAISNDNGDYSSVTGAGSVFGGLGPYTLSYPFTDFSDPITPDGTAEVAFAGNNGNDGAIDKDSGTYRTTFWTFPFEAIASAPGREAIMDTVATWCQLDQVNYSAALSGDTTAGDLPGTSITHDFTLWNMGDDDGYSLSVASGDWTTTLLTTSPLSVTGGMSETISVDVAIPPLETIHGSDTFTLTVQSLGDPNLVLTATGTTNAVTNPGMTMSGKTSALGRYGETVTYTLTMTNTGNYTDTMDMSVGPHDWGMTASHSNMGPLAPGASTVMEVYVTIGTGHSDSVVLTFTSGLDDTVTESVMLTTTNEFPHVLFTPIIFTE